MKTSRVRIDHLFGVVILLVLALLVVGGTTVSGLNSQLDSANDDAANWAAADTSITAMILTSFDTQQVIQVGVTEGTGSTEEFVDHATQLVVQVSEIDSQVRPFLSAEEADLLAAHAEAIITDLNDAVMAATTALAARDRGDTEAAGRAEADVEESFTAMRSGVTTLQGDFRAFHAADLAVRDAEAASARTLATRIAVVAGAMLVVIISIGWRIRYREKLATAERRRSAARLQAYADDLAAERALLGGVIETIPLQISWKDEDLRIVGCNESFAAYFGVPPIEGEQSSFAGRNVGEWCERKIVDALDEIERQVLETGQPVVGVELEDKALDVSVSFVASVVPLVAGDGAPGLLTVLDDVTDQVSMQMQLQQAQKLESVGQLAAGIAHEINTPMQYIGDNAHFLKATVQRLLTVVESAEKLLDEDEADSGSAREELQTRIEKAKLPILRERAPKAADDALAGVENVSRIVRAMKRFSHPGSDEMAPVDINEALDTTLTVCKNEWKYAADVETDFAELPPVEANLGPLNQVWLNLIVNAAHAVADRFGEEKGLIRVASRQVDDDHIAVSITDNGCGIPEENLQRVFDHFFTTKAVGKGTGQGLAIAHQVVVDEHHGRIDVESVVGEGTTFTLVLPISQSVGDASAGEAPPEELVA